MHTELTDEETADLAEGGRRPGRGLRVYAWLYAGVMYVVAVVYCLQAVLAGQFLSGVYGALSWHQYGATFSDVLLFCGVVVGVLLRWRGRGRVWPLWVAVGLLVANQVQNAAGAGRLVSLHVPLGVAMIVVAVLVALRVHRVGQRSGGGEG
ncbi:hypothetical protein MMF93_33175 [Streptomyces tubbatahanensis]|uniref:Integral membrane protein n=1 Tax=Streptomyces tubbatahanensis TaxID=2923272 RepID=A0ABY3Y1T3_9ACTN|nr:hypothetical protein [Streptomyces tubbatahanensis]UNT00801.1 hypothetical protein MMF93_33175 [Streptomyces tubbatahanensis]